MYVCVVVFPLLADANQLPPAAGHESYNVIASVMCETCIMQKAGLRARKPTDLITLQLVSSWQWHYMKSCFVVKSFHLTLVVYYWV